MEKVAVEGVEGVPLFELNNGTLLLRTGPLERALLGELHKQENKIITRAKHYMRATRSCSRTERQRVVKGIE